jgi:predicted RecA/RadA family phage recombinase
VGDLAKVSAQAWTEGAKIYWDDTAKNFTTTSGGNTLAGVAAAAAANPSATGKVRLDGVAR